jgi:hypothetical protein
MDAAQFLALVVAPGNYLVITFKFPDRGMSARFFPRADIGSAVGYAGWAARKGADVWFAVASYHEAGQRTQDNAEQFKCLWFDADISRPGDKKRPGTAFADEAEALAFVQKLTDSGVLPPNLIVNSGYGLHLYWVFVDPLDPHEWLPYAEALKAALIHHGAKGDVGLTTDSARVLRLPGTFNCKVPGSPAPVRVLTEYSRSEYGNNQLWRSLSPYASKRSIDNMPTKQLDRHVLAGTPPALAKVRKSSLTAAAQAGVSSRREHTFERIATQCLQAKRSLAVNGVDDDRRLWYLGFITLASFCSDGAHYAHEIGKAHPAYDPAETDAELQRAANEQRSKGNGAPLCKTFDSMRPGVCQGCPFWGRIGGSPFSLGVEKETEGTDELPSGFRRQNGEIQREIVDKKTGDAEWLRLITGDVYRAVLDEVPGTGHQITFTYLGPEKKTFDVVTASPSPEAGRIMAHFGPKGITLDRHNALHFGDFIVAWISKLRAMCAVRSIATYPFGWAKNLNGGYDGFAVGGVLYKADGTEEPAPGGDPQIVEWYRPRGTLEDWRKACDFVTQNRPDLQVLVAVSFAAPLLEFTGQSGVVISAWSRDSAVGKSSAFRVGQAVYSHPLNSMMSLKDTDNAILYKVGQTKIMPAYWDEVQLDKDDAKKRIRGFFDMGQGREKARMTADIKLREARDWKTIMMMASNAAIMEHVVAERSETDAAALRLFEFQITHPQMPLSIAAGQTVQLTETNYGSAGRIYAKWLASNAETAQRVVSRVGKKLEEELDPSSGERFHMAGITCILAGAGIANKLKLVSFDIPAMDAYLKAALAQARDRRKRDLPVNDGQLDIERVLGRFHTEHTRERMLTTIFQRKGKPDPRFSVLSFPNPNIKSLVIQTAQKDKLMRIDKSVWQTWCRDRNLPSGDYQNELVARYGAKEGRGMLGAGTHYTTGRIYYIEIPTSHPDLEDYNYDNSNPTTNTGSPLNVLSGGKPI